MSGEITCPACAKLVWPAMQLSASGASIVPTCPSCMVQLPARVEDFQHGEPVAADGEKLAPVSVGPAPNQPPAPPLAGPPPPYQPRQLTPNLPSAPGPAWAPLPASPAPPADPVRLLTDRLTFLDGEDARLEGQLAESRSRLAGVRAEAKRLRKMLAVAGPSLTESPIR